MNKAFFKYLIVILLVLTSIYIYQLLDISKISSLLEQSRSDIGDVGFLTAALIFSLRFISIIIPIIPGTYCSILAGYLFGLESGLLVIFCADFISCSTSFFLARQLGRDFVAKILGNRQMAKIERVSKKYLEHNFFFMTGLLMTQFFDFVCYAIGLTKIPAKKFLPALIISIIISDIPFVAGGFAIKEIKDISINSLLNGEVSVLNGPYLIIFLTSFIGILCLGLISSRLNRKFD